MNSNQAILLLIAQFITQLKVSGFVAWIIEQMKKSQWKGLSWINANTPWVTRIVAAIGAALSAAGIHYTWNSTAGTLMITGLSLTAVVSGLWQVAISYLLQHGWYRAAIQSKP